MNGNSNQSVGDSSDGSLARTKRNSKISAPGNLWQLVLFSLFKPDPMKTEAQPTNSSQPTNTSDLIIKSLEELHFVHSAKLIPYSEETKMYFIVQMIVLGPAIIIESRIYMSYILCKLYPLISQAVTYSLSRLNGIAYSIGPIP